MAMRTGQLELRTSQIEHSKLYLGVIVREIDTNGLEDRYLHNTNGLNVYHKNKNLYLLSGS